MGTNVAKIPFSNRISIDRVCYEVLRASTVIPNSTLNNTFGLRTGVISCHICTYYISTNIEEVVEKVGGKGAAGEGRAKGKGRGKKEK